MSVKVTIGHLVSDENKRAHGGKAGDQTGRESYLCDWYGPWEYVFRAKDPAVRKKIAQTMVDICNNENAGGYDQYERTTLYNEAKRLNWDIKAITKPCESDCSASVAVCINAAGIPISKDMYTGNEKQLIEATGAFETYSAAEYTQQSDKLKKGDILQKKGHTSIVTNVETTTEKATRYYPKYKGNSKSIVDALNTLGINSTFNNRKKIAITNKISNYTGTAEQNTKMLSLLIAGKLIKP